MLYAHLDVLREQAGGRLAATLREQGGTQQERSQRESAALLYTEKVSRLSAVENGLCFGRLDFDDAEKRYIGRIGIFDEDGDFEPLLIDWRAPAARPFYLATAAAPEGVKRRRQIRTKRRTVVGLDDEILDLTAARHSTHESVTGEAALMSAVTAGRTGRMRDIVETIQAEQDRVIRADMNGVLVVQGGPGTGKTAVALHRAAYLLYTHRQTLSTRAVLIVGPNPTFLRYVSQVLPSLAETGVLLCTLGDLFPRISARLVESPEVAEVKGRLAIAELLAAAVRDRQGVPDEAVEIPRDGEPPLLLTREIAEDARARARRSGRLHNLAREIFDAEVIQALAMQYSDRIGLDPYADDPLGADDAPIDAQLLDEADLAEIRRELREDEAVHAALSELWPLLSPQRLLRDLFGDRERLASAGAASGFADDELMLLYRERAAGWSPADVPLLDEAAELLGEDERAARAAVRQQRLEERDYAEGALEIAMGSRTIDDEDAIEREVLAATDLIEATRLAERQEEREALTAAERAAVDRKWAFGHIIVDEAQELSPMAWRLLMRRSPSRSMTLVGDVAQTSDPGGASSWQDALGPYVSHRWRLMELQVNYRTPAEIMNVASGVLAAIDPALSAPRSVREAGVEPWAWKVPDDQLATSVVDHVIKESKLGNIAVIVPGSRVGDLGRAVTDAVPEAAVGEQPDLENRVVVLTVRQAKGLEFDSVVVVDPSRIVTESPRGLSDLYVALTRATQRLGILHPDDLAPELGLMVE